jgi:hypothetical protein
VKELVRNYTGVLFITNYKLQFVPERMVQEQETGFFMVPFGYIESLKESSDVITISCKDERVLKYKFEVDAQFQACRKAIRERSFPASHSELFATKHAPTLKKSRAVMTSHAVI